MEMIKGINAEVYVKLMNNDLDKWTLHMDEGRRWGMLGKNTSKSLNGLLKLVTAILRLTYNQIVN